MSFLNKDKIMDCLSELKNTPAGLDAQLAKTVRFGIGFHHAGFYWDLFKVEQIKIGNFKLIEHICQDSLLKSEKYWRITSNKAIYWLLYALAPCQMESTFRPDGFVIIWIILIGFYLLGKILT